MTRHSVHYVPVCTLSSFPTLFISDNRSADFSGISNTHSNLAFGIPLLHRLNLLAFIMLILWVVGLTKKAFLVYVIFLDLLFFCWSARKQYFVAQFTTEAKYVAAASCCS
jgi:hypothetical protein